MNPVPRLWPGETVIILAGGPSLTQAQVDACRSRRVIAIKDAIRLAPFADVLYGCGADAGRWWDRCGDSVSWFAGPRYTLDPRASKWATVLRNAGEAGLETEPDGLRTGANSGYQAINLAFHLGAARILLLGFDCQSTGGKQHWFGAHPHGIAPPYERFLKLFPTIIEPLRARGVEVVNCTPQTALDCFPKMSLSEAMVAA